MTLASMFNADHINTLAPDPLEGIGPQFTILHEFIQSGVMIDALHDAGYSVISIASPFAGFTLRRADEIIDSGHVADFELSLLRVGRIPQLAPDLQRSWLFDQQRQRVLASMASLKALALTPSNRPRFVLAHIMSPHPPVVFDATGSAVEVSSCFPQACSFWGVDREADHDGGILDQIRYLNDLVLDVVPRIIVDSKRPPVVVVFSDHGLRHDLADRHERLRNLFLSYTPDHAGLFANDTTLVNVIPTILEAYVGIEHENAREASFLPRHADTVANGLFPLDPWPRD
jgi:hypothetical protein